jgi:ArsR family transcriptional regulator
MESNAAVEMLSALGHPGRLAVFRLLVKAGPEGLPAGEIARSLGMLPNTLSANLNILSRAGLTTSRREGRSILHAARYAQMRELLGWLVEDCCNGRLEICAPLAEMAQVGCAAS